MSCSAVFQEWPYCRGAHQERASESGFQREAQEDILKKVQEIFRDRLGIDDKRVFQKVWGQAEHKFHWTVKDPLTEEAKTRIEKALRGVLVYTGPGVDIEDSEGDGFDPKMHEYAQYLLGKEIPISSEWTMKEKIESSFL